MQKAIICLLIIFCCFITKAQNVGIGTTAPVARLHVADSNVVFTAGDPFLSVTGNVPVGGAGGRMLWYAGKTAFRAGYVDDAQWNKDSIGYFSFASGYSTRATNQYSSALGRNTIASGTSASAFGYFTTASGSNSTASGSYTIAAGQDAIAMGNNTLSGGFASVSLGFATYAKADMSTALGSYTKARSPNSLVIGFNNDTSNTNRLFEIGNGTADNARANALTVLNTGNVGIGTASPNASAILDISSSSKGLLLPRMTTAQRNAIVSPATGLVIFNTDDDCTDVFDGANWIRNCGFKITGMEAMPAGNWSEASDFSGPQRSEAVCFSIGGKAYAGTGLINSSSFQYSNELWEFDPSTNAWSQKANFGGAARFGATGFAIGSKGYIGTGLSTSGYTNDFWEYDPATNTWIQRASFPGTGRYRAAGFSSTTNGYITTGYDGSFPVDLWEYNPASNTWTQRANFPGSGRSSPAALSINAKGYVGMGLGQSSILSDFWEYDPAGNAWTPKASFGGGGRRLCPSFTIGSLGYIGPGENGSFNVVDFWEYSPATNTWTQKASFPGASRTGAAGFAIGTNGYIGIGSGRTDFWKYNTQPINVNTYSNNNLPVGVSVTDGSWKRLGNDLYSVVPGNVTINRYLGIGTGNANAPLQFSNTIANRKMVLWETANNDHQFYGIGVNSGVLRYQADGTVADHVFYAGVNGTTSNELVRIKGTGLVGIGTSTPAKQTEIIGPASAIPVTLVIGNRGGFGPAAMEFVSDYGLASQWRPGYIRSNDAGGFTGSVEIYTNGTGSGNLYGSVKGLEVRNGITYTSTGTVSSWSDARLKSGITPFTAGLDVIRKINPVSFSYNDLSPFSTGKQQIGIIAQELEKIAPYMVDKTSTKEMEDMRSVNSQAYTFLLINAVKEQQQQIEQQQHQIDELKKIVEQLLKK
ncbi:MAG: tail fiber domain-containing protein [Chitinophagaceae bacterium]|nr:tail fiber domain-containing protein [Chitinophagaceae bacterium]